MHFFLHLVAEAGSDFDQFHAAFGAGIAQLFQRLLDAAGRGGLFLGEQSVQLRQGQRLVGRQQGGFDDAGDEGLVHSIRCFLGVAGCEEWLVSGFGAGA